MFAKSLNSLLAVLLLVACSDSKSNDPVVGVGGTGALQPGGGGTGNEPAQEWLPSWATTIQRNELTNVPMTPLPNNTVRQFVWPTVSGQEIRIQLSNQRGSAPVDFQKVHIAKALTTEATPGNSMGQIDTATDLAFTFGGAPSVTIPAGETVWSDPLTFNLEEIKLTAITVQFGANVPLEITGHPGSRTTSYIATGDVVSAQSVTGETQPRWYFINAIEVMAPANAYAVAVLGDSITDGYGVLETFGRWTDALTTKIQGDAQVADTRSVLNFGMGANNLTVSGDFQDSGVVRFGRDVLPRDKIKWLIVFEGTNDIIFSNVQAPAIIAAYQDIIQRAHADGIIVYGAPITPTNQGNAAIREEVNAWIRTSGEFDAVIDFQPLIGDPNDPNGILALYNNDGLHPNLAGYQAMGNSIDLSLFYQTMGN
jgi:lysophospholipase L1-like esterase